MEAGTTDVALTESHSTMPEVKTLADLPHFLALFKRDFPALSDWLGSGGNVNDIEKWNGTSLLMQASFIGDLEMAKFLLSHNAAIDQADYYKQTPLMFAALKGHCKVVQLLLSRGADVFAKSDADMSAFAIAAKEGHLGILEIIQHEVMQRKEATKPSLPVPLPVLEPVPQTVSELSQKALARLIEITDKIEYNEIKDMTEKLYQVSHEFKLRVENIYCIDAKEQRRTYEIYKRNLKTDERIVTRFYGHDLYFVDHAIHTSFLLSKQVGNKMLGKFGMGAYFTTDSTQSAIHSSEHNRYILLCEIALGAFWTIHCPMQHLNPQEIQMFGYDSVYGLRNSEKHGGVEHDQFVIYNIHQAVPLYLIVYEKEALS